MVAAEGGDVERHLLGHVGLVEAHREGTLGAEHQEHKGGGVQ